MSSRNLGLEGLAINSRFSRFHSIVSDARARQVAKLNFQLVNLEVL